MSDKYPLLRSIRNAFITGLLILAPLAVSVFVFVWLVDNIGGRFTSQLYFIPAEWLEKENLRLFWDLVSTCIVFLFITMLGYLSRYFVGKWALSLTESLLGRVPFINTVYKTVKQIIETFSTQRQAIFQKTVLIEYPRKGIYAIGFLTSDAKGEPQHRTSRHLKNVFLPTTPNPTSGFLLMLPDDEVTELDMTIGEGMKLIISGGAVVPPFPAEEGPVKAVAITNPEQQAGETSA